MSIHHGSLIKTRYYKYTYEDWVQPKVTSNTSNGTISSTIYHSNHQPYHAFNGNKSGEDKYLSNTTSSGNITWITPEAIKISSCKIYTTQEGGYLNRYPKTISIYGSDNGSSWELLGSASNYSNPSSGGYIEVICSNKKRYNQTKWEFGANFGGDVGVAVSEIEITAERITGSVETTSSDYDYSVFDDGKIKDIYFGTKNTNCLTYIPQDIKLDLSPLNVTVTGSPTISNGVVSGFSDSNYLLVSSNPSSVSSFEMVFKVKANSISSVEHAIVGQGSSNYKTPQLAIDSGNFWLGVSQNGSSWTTIKGGTPVTGKDYWVKATWDGSQMGLYVSENGSTYTTIGTTAVTKVTWSEQIRIGDDAASGDYFTGSIDISQSYIKINDSLWWQGGTGNLTLKAGSKVYVPNGWTEQTETTVTKVEYECFTYSFMGINNYMYCKTPYKVGDSPYTTEKGTSLATSSNDLIIVTGTPITSIDSNGNMTFKDLSVTATRYPSGDLTKTTTTIVGSGSMVFKEVVISSDRNSTYNGNGTRFVYLNTSGYMVIGDELRNTVSGSTDSLAGTSWHVWYDRANNKVVRYEADATTTSTQFSLPIAIITVSNGAISSIDQVFNGFGYIGSTAFALPGIKGLMPNGYNADGTYKSIEFVNSGVRLQTFTWNPGADSLFLRTNGNFADLHYVSQTSQPVKTYTAWYNPATNTYKASASDGNTFSDTNLLYVCKFTDDNSTPAKITSLTPNPVQPETTVRKIGRVFKGSTLVYGYGINQTLFENSTAGTYTVDLKYGGNYSIVIVGGGGGGAGTQSTNSAAAAGGGSGACIQCNVRITKPVTLTIVVGNTGAGATARDSGANGGNGGASSIKFDNDLTYTANGGTQGQSWWKSGATAGAGASKPTGITSNSYITVSNVTTLAGQTGGSTTSNGGGTVSGGASVYGGYGKGGDGYASALNSAGYAGTTGYVKIIAL